MQLAIAIHKDAETGYGVTVPDVPGCFSAGDTVEEAIFNAKEAVFTHLETLLQLGEDIAVKPSDIEQLRLNPDYQGALWALVDVDLAALDPSPERFNVSMPRFVLARIDRYAADHKETRSGFLARAALEVISAHP